MFSTEKHLKGHIIHLAQVALQSESLYLQRGQQADVSADTGGANQSDRHQWVTAPCYWWGPGVKKAELPVLGCYVALSDRKGWSALRGRHNDHSLNSAANTCWAVFHQKKWPHKRYVSSSHRRLDSPSFSASIPPIRFLAWHFPTLPQKSIPGWLRVCLCGYKKRLLHSPTSQKQIFANSLAMDFISQLTECNSIFPLIMARLCRSKTKHCYYNRLAAATPARKHGCVSFRISR